MGWPALAREIVAALVTDGWITEESGPFDSGDWRSGEKFEGEYEAEVWVRYHDPGLLNGEPAGDDGDATLWFRNP